MSIYIKGDIHADIDINDLAFSKWPESRELNKNDVVIILGDFGVGFIDEFHLKWLRDRPYTVCFLRGNHDNIELLKTLPEKEMFGKKVSELYKNIYWLHDGETYFIDNKSFFIFGGAQSTDKHLRKQNIDWWHEEVPSYSIYNSALENLYNRNFNIDYVLTHTCPTSIIKEIYAKHGISELERFEPRFNDPTCKMLDSFQEKIVFKKWYFGHMHEDVYFGLYKNYICSYHKIHKVI